MDSHKRRPHLIPYLASAEGRGALAEWECEHAISPQFSGQDLLHLLAQWLSAREKQVLACRAEGLTVEESARRLGVSHQAVSKHRRRIADLVAHLSVPSF